jgi:hypothetical protein
MFLSLSIVIFSVKHNRIADVLVKSICFAILAIMATSQRTMLRLQDVASAEAFRDTIGFIQEQDKSPIEDVDIEGNKLAEIQPDGKNSLHRYGRMILRTLHRYPRRFRAEDPLDQYAQVLGRLFDGEMARLYQVRQDEGHIVGLGSIILGQAIHDAEGQGRPQANLEYFLRPGAEADDHRLAAGMLIDKLLSIEPKTIPKGRNFAQQRHYSYSDKPIGNGHYQSVREHRSRFAGFAAVPSHSLNETIGFDMDERMHSSGYTMQIAPVREPDFYDNSHNGVPVRLYHTVTPSLLSQ